MSQAAAAPPAGPPAGSSGSLTGRWRKEVDASDSVVPACDMVQLPWLYRQAMKFLKVLEVEDTAEHFRTTLKAGGIMDVIETYPWSGKEVVHGRRDKRKGSHSGRVTRSASGAPCLLIEWGDPFAGKAVDTFELIEDGATLTHTSDLTAAADGTRVVYKTVYKRE